MLGTYSVNLLGRETKKGTLYDIKRLVGFVRTHDGRIIRPAYQRVYTCYNNILALDICETFNALFSRQCESIFALACYGGMFVIYLNGKINDHTYSRAQGINITPVFGVLPIKNTKIRVEKSRVFDDFKSYLKTFCS